MTKIEKIRGFFKSGLDEAKAELEKLEAKKSKGSFAYWAEWHALDYIRCELVLNIWADLNKSLGTLIHEGKTEDEIIKWIGEVRDEFVKNILKGPPGRSTNPMANLVECENIESYSYFAIGFVNTYSLEALLYNLQKMK
jgi:hypothetical protein